MKLIILLAALLASVAYCQTFQIVGQPYLLAEAGQPFEYKINTAGGPVPITVKSSNLPPDLKLQQIEITNKRYLSPSQSQMANLIKGIPRSPGLYQFTVSAQDGLKNFDTKIFTLLVGKGSPISNPPLPQSLNISPPPPFKYQNINAIPPTKNTPDQDPKNYSESQLDQEFDEFLSNYSSTLKRYQLISNNLTRLQSQITVAQNRVKPFVSMTIGLQASDLQIIEDVRKILITLYLQQDSLKKQRQDLQQELRSQVTQGQSILERKSGLADNPKEQTYKENPNLRTL